MKTTTLLIRRDTKQAWTQAAKQTMLDGVERLTAWVEQMNDSLGWKKYGVSE